MNPSPIQVVPTGWYPCEVIGSTVDGQILEMDLSLSTRRYFRRRITARLDLSRRASLSPILPRIFAATDAGVARDSSALHGRAFNIRLAVEGEINVVVDAKSLTRPPV